MNLSPRFPLGDVTVRCVTAPRKVSNPVYSDDFWQISQEEFAMQVEGVGHFYAGHGKEVEYTLFPGTAPETLELYLNGSVFGAILHQRQILPFHGSSFIYDGQGIMLCGESGAGKSSLTAAFCLSGARFLTDDVTPIVFPNHLPMICPLSDRIKLWEDTLEQLEKGNSHLTPVIPEYKKYYFPMDKHENSHFPLQRIFIIEPGEFHQIEEISIKGMDAFVALRNEVYRWEYLEAMTDSEKTYLDKLLGIIRFAKVTKIRRPVNVTIKIMVDYLKNKISANSLSPK